MEIGSVTAKNSRDQFLQLLVAQLQNQDPIEPVKQEDFLGQMAQFSTLEGIENMNANFEQLLDAQCSGTDAVEGLLALQEKASTTDEDLNELVALQRQSYKVEILAQGTSFIGRHANFDDPDNAGTTESGIVEEVSYKDGSLVLKIGDQDVPFDNVQGFFFNPG